MLTTGLVLAALAAGLHVLIFYLESVAWESPLARRTFGGTPEEARPHAFYAFNQGFYNLFLALQTSPLHRAAAVKQGTLPALAVVTTVVALVA